MKKALIAGALLTTLTTASAFAKDIKVITKTVDIEDGQKLSFSVPVGSFDLDTCNCSEVSIKVKVEASDSNWSLFSSKDVEDAELSIRDRRSGLNFEVAEQDTKQKWVVTVPASSALNVEVGVGHVELKDFDNDLNAEVGVGHIEVELGSDDYERVTAESGVGDASIRHLKGDVKNKRSMVSDSARYSGNGKYTIDVEVGVGEIKISGN